MDQWWGHIIGGRSSRGWWGAASAATAAAALPGSSGWVLPFWEPGIVQDMPGAVAAGWVGSLRLPVQNAGFKMSLFQ